MIKKMKSTEFCYWLQGCFELANPTNGLSAAQVETLRRHLDMVFFHEIDKSYPNQEKLNEIHNKPKVPFQNTTGNELLRC